MPLTPPVYAAIGAPANWTRYIALAVPLGAAPAEPASATADRVTATVAIESVALAERQARPAKLRPAARASRRRGRRRDVISFALPASHHGPIAAVGTAAYFDASFPRRSSMAGRKNVGTPVGCALLGAPSAVRAAGLLRLADNRPRVPHRTQVPELVGVDNRTDRLDPAVENVERQRADHIAGPVAEDRARLAVQLTRL